MTASITTPLVDATASVPSLPGGGILPGHLLIQDYEGKSALEHLMPRTAQGSDAAPFKASWWAVEPGCTSFPDRHEVQEVWLIARGAGRMTLGERELDITGGQIVFIPSDLPHLVTATGTEPLEAYSIWW